MYSNSKLTEVNQNPNQLFIGLDVHKMSWSVCIRTKELMHRTFSQKADADTLDEYIKRNFPGYSATIAYEAGCFGFSISRALESKGYTCLVLNAADIPGSDKEEKRKTDRGDCRKIARELSKGNLQGIYQPNLYQESFRSMFRQREALTRDFRRTKTRIRSLLSCYGIVCPKEFESNRWSKAFRVWLGEMTFDQTTLRAALDSLLNRYDFFRKELLSLEVELRKHARTFHKREYEILRSIPGIGPVVSLAILSEIGDVNRFKRVDDLCGYIGLVPNIDQSGDTIKVQGITQRCHSLLRSYFVEIAWTAISRDPELLEYYKRYSGKKTTAKIIIKVARKLLIRVYYCLKTNKLYEINHNMIVKNSTHSPLKVIDKKNL